MADQSDQRPEKKAKLAPPKELTVPHAELTVLTEKHVGLIDKINQIDGDQLPVWNKHPEQKYMVLKFKRPGQRALFCDGRTRILVRAVDGTPDGLYKKWSEEFWPMVHEFFDSELDFLRDLLQLVVAVSRCARASFQESNVCVYIKKLVDHQRFYGNDLSELTREIYYAARQRTPEYPDGPDVRVQRELVKVIKDLKAWMANMYEEGKRIKRLIGDNDIALETVGSHEIARDCPVLVQCGRKRYNPEIGGFIDRFEPDRVQRFHICGKAPKDVWLCLKSNGTGALFIGASSATSKCLVYELGKTFTPDQILECQYDTGRKFKVKVTVSVEEEMKGHTVQAVRANNLDEAVIGVYLIVKASCTYGSTCYTKEVHLEMVVCREHRVQIIA